MPWVSGKCFTRLRTWRIGSPRWAGVSMAATAASSVGASTLSTGTVFGVSATSRAVGSAMEGLLPEVARARAAGQLPALVTGDREQRRGVRTADVLRLRAARIEGAAVRDPQQVGRQALDRVQLLALLVQARDRVEQTPGVRVRGVLVQ